MIEAIRQWLRRVMFGRASTGLPSDRTRDIQKGNDAHRNPSQRDPRSGGVPMQPIDTMALA
jgi:hypothetical protein